MNILIALQVIQSVLADVKGLVRGSCRIFSHSDGRYHYWRRLGVIEIAAGLPLCVVIPQGERGPEGFLTPR